MSSPFSITSLKPSQHKRVRLEENKQLSSINALKQRYYWTRYTHERQLAQKVGTCSTMCVCVSFRFRNVGTVRTGGERTSPLLRLFWAEIPAHFTAAGKLCSWSVLRGENDQTLRVGWVNK